MTNLKPDVRVRLPKELGGGEATLRKFDKSGRAVVIVPNVGPVVVLPSVLSAVLPEEPPVGAFYAAGPVWRRVATGNRLCWFQPNRPEAPYRTWADLNERFPNGSVLVPAGEATVLLDAVLHSVWLHGRWRELTRQMTTEEKDAAADAVERHWGRDAEYEQSAETMAALRWWRS